MRRLRNRDEPEVAIPVFDRAIELSRAGARVISRDVPVVIVEGNYLFLTQEPWNSLSSFFDLTVMIREPAATLRERPVNRWLSYGFDTLTAIQKVEGNDLLNAATVLSLSCPVDLEVSGYAE